MSGSALLLVVTFITSRMPASATLTMTMNMISSIRLIPRWLWRVHIAGLCLDGNRGCANSHRSSRTRSPQRIKIYTDWRHRKCNPGRRINIVHTARWQIQCCVTKSGNRSGQGESVWDGCVRRANIPVLRDCFLLRVAQRGLHLIGKTTRFEYISVKKTRGRHGGKNADDNHRHDQFDNGEASGSLAKAHPNRQMISGNQIL